MLDQFIEDHIDGALIVVFRVAMVMWAIMLVMILDAVIFHYYGWSIMGEAVARVRLMSRRG